MPRQGSPSPARRPQLSERDSSSQSLSRGSPTAGHLSKSHNKGSSTKLHKSHAVGHGRHPHARVPSYGKGLHKLSKLGPGETGDGAGHTRHHNRSASHTPTGSPTAQNFKRNSSQISLPRINSKVDMKRNVSNISLQRNASGIKMGNQPKSEKAQTKKNLSKNGTDDAPLKGTASFSVGNEVPDEDWEETSNSQSPHTTRHSLVGRKISPLEDPPSPDEPPERSPPILPNSPPQSPPTNPSAFVDLTNENSKKGSRYSRDLDGDEVSNRLLNRSHHNAEAKLSTISATITPNGSSGSPAFNHSHNSSIAAEPSMPADGISRFLGSTGSTTGSATSGSITHLQSNLAHLNHPDFHRPASPANSTSTAKPEARRVKSAANLTHPRLNNGESSSASPPKAPHPDNNQKPFIPTNPPRARVSPYESARSADPSAGKSLTQLKLDLQRMSTLHDTPSSSHPLSFQHGSVIGVQNLHAGSGEMAARLARQYQQAGMEYRNARRFYPDLVVGSRLGKKVAEKAATKRNGGLKGKGSGKSSTTTPGSSSGERSGGRVRVRFEVGRRSPGEGEEGDEEGSLEGDGDGNLGFGVEGLLRRMWEHQGLGVGED